MSRAAEETLQKVASEFEAEVLADLEAGRKEALARIESARKETSVAVAKTLEASLKQAESVKRQVVGTAELEARNAQLRSLEKAVNDAFEMAAKNISNASGALYEKAMVNLVKEGIEVIGPKANVYCASKDKKMVASAIRKLSAGQPKISFEEEPIETTGGVVLTTTDGAIRFDNTFEARLERMRPTLRKEIAAILTGA
jgi:V/A-type H+-transporting ATPase subunit E